MDTEFPTNPDDFDKDERISFSKLEDRFIAVHDDGSEFEFDPKLKHWVPIDDDWEREFGRQPPLSPVPEAGERKRKHRDSAEGAEDNLDPSAPAQRPRKKAKAPPKPKQNTAVYVTGLPTDATVDEIHDLFSRKGGLIAEEIDSRAPRIKLYRDEAGDFKGDALVVFFKPDSVRMAIMLLDDTDFRYDAQGKGQGRMRVQEADSSYKKVQYDQNGDAAAKEPGQQAEARRPRSEKDRQKVIRKTQKLDAKLADWSDDEDDRFPALAEANSKLSKTVILRHMFRIFELEEDPASILDIKEDIRDECSKLGTVTSVVLYDLEPEGIVTVKFREAAAAAACVEAMNGRPFDGRVVDARVADSKVKFRKSDGAQDDEDSD